MTNRTAPALPTGRRKPYPLDILTMRQTAGRLLGPDAELPSAEELDTLLLTLRGHVMLAIPDLETTALALPLADVPRACALACIGEARMKLNAEPSGPGLPAGIAFAQKLSRVLMALCDHHENLGVTHP